MLSALENGDCMITFRHVVGKSTLTEGMAVPKDLENWIQAPAVGEKREINLLFDEGRTKAILRRIANGRGNVQIKYETWAGSAFRNWLRRLFIATEGGAVGEYLELIRVEGDVFRVNAYPISRQPAKRGTPEQWDRWLTTQERAVYEPLLSEPYVLDLDNTVKPLYGHQEGAELGYITWTLAEPHVVTTGMHGDISCRR